MPTPNGLPIQPHLLQVCDWCAGAGCEPNEELALVDCMICSGGGYSPVVGDLGPTLTYRTRPYVWNFGLRRFEVTRKGKRETYQIDEYTPDPVAEHGPARAFRFLKESDGATYYCLATRGGVSCDCAAKTYETSHRANVRNYIVGGPMHATGGCVHVDAVRQLLDYGLLDTPRAALGVANPPADAPF